MTMDHDTASRPSAADARAQIVDVLGECVFHALGLKESLREERTALEAQDTEALDAAVRSKGDCVDRLARLENKRRQLCESAGFAAGPDQMDRMSEWCDDNAVVHNCWMHLMSIVADCNALNLTNGAIINTRQQMISDNLAVLRGGEIDPKTYQRQGQDGAAMNRRSLARA